MKGIYCLFTLMGGMLISLSAMGQIKIDRRSELQIGDRFTVKHAFPVLNEPTDRLDLSEYKDRLLILDFFDTFCTACIANMPKLVSLQKELENKVKIIQVTWQDKKTIQKFFRTNSFLKEHDSYPTVIYSDTLLHQYFPHQTVPHVAWIWNGKVTAVTAADVLNSANIRELISSNRISLPRKNDFLSLGTMAKIGADDIAYSRLTRYNPDLRQAGGLNYQLDSISGKYRTYFNNIPILNAYLSLMRKWHNIDFLVTKDRLEWKVVNKSRYNYDENEREPTRWMQANAICYERVDTVKRTEEEQSRIVFQDLNSYLGLNVYVGKSKRKCLLLQKTEKIDVNSRNINTAQNLEGTSVLAFLLDYSKQFPPVIDEVKSKQNIAIGDYKNLEELNFQLSRYGLVLTPSERDIDVIVIEEM